MNKITVNRLPNDDVNSILNIDKETFFDVNYKSNNVPEKFRDSKEEGLLMVFSSESRLHLILSTSGTLYVRCIKKDRKGGFIPILQMANTKDSNGWFIAPKHSSIRKEMINMTNEVLKDSLERQIRNLEKNIGINEKVTTQKLDVAIANGASFEARQEIIKEAKLEVDMIHGQIASLQGEMSNLEVSK